jgi:hypothetical protein
LKKYEAFIEEMKWADNDFTKLIVNSIYQLSLLNYPRFYGYQLDPKTIKIVKLFSYLSSISSRKLKSRERFQ